MGESSFCSFSRNETCLGLCECLSCKPSWWFCLRSSRLVASKSEPSDWDCTSEARDFCSPRVSSTRNFWTVVCIRSRCRVSSRTSRTSGSVNASTARSPRRSDCACRFSKYLLSFSHERSGSCNSCEWQALMREVERLAWGRTVERFTRAAA